ncbi:MAG TPA: MBG domain-containing protein [Puia sp.]|nr:MBG domain-containing protein [Puia sp.]
MNGRILIFTFLFGGFGAGAEAQPGISISPAAIPNGQYGTAYPNQSLTATGGSSPYTFTVTSGHLPAGMTLTQDGSLSGTPAAAGKYAFTVTAQGKKRGRGKDGNDGAASGSVKYTMNVDPATVTVTADNAAMTYGGSLPVLAATYTGFVNGDNAKSLKTEARVTTVATMTSPAGTYAINAAGAADPNYTFKYNAGVLTITKASLRITADSKSMAAGSSLPTFTVSYSGFVNRDDAASLTRQPVITTTATAASPAGTYPITASGASDPNYAISYSPGTLTISAGTVHITANAETKQYGAPDPALTYSVSGLPGGNSGAITGSLSRAQGEDAGRYAITIGSLSAGGNYRIDFTGNFLTITKASQQIDWAQKLTVGCNTSSQVLLNARASSGLPVAYSVSDNSIATVSGNVLTLLKPGTAVITATQVGDGNYNAAPPATDTVVFQPASLIAQHFNDAIFFDNSSGNYVQWQWYKDGAAVAGDTTPYYSEEPSLDGQYFVIATARDGQQVQSCTLTIAPGSAIAGGLQVQPNPVRKGELATVVSNYPAAALQGAVLQISDIAGRVLQQIANVQPSMQITVPAGNGLYIVSLMLAGGQRVTTNLLVQE